MVTVTFPLHTPSGDRTAIPYTRRLRRGALLVGGRASSYSSSSASGESGLSGNGTSAASIMSVSSSVFKVIAKMSTVSGAAGAGASVLLGAAVVSGAEANVTAGE